MSTSTPKKIIIIAHEAWSDHAGAQLIKLCFAQKTETPFYAVGGSKMHHAGADIFLETSELTEPGWLNTLINFPRTISTRRIIEKKSLR